ncbi:MAG: hypothetical protein KAR42_14445 [candidate division Zixibacteria bacterium]|nr:hypothetical protein [candidate division Zixibacteria bacterium]
MEQSKQSNQYVLLYGLKLEKSSIRIMPGLHLNTLTAPLSLYDLSIAGKAGFTGWPALGPYLNGNLCEISSTKPDQEHPSCTDRLNRARAVSDLLHLLGYGGHLCLASSAYSWSTIAETTDDGKTHDGNSEELPPFKGSILDQYFNLIIPKDAHEVVTIQDAQWIADRFDIFVSMMAKHEKLRFAVDSTIDWRYLKDPRAAIARLWSGIEAIFAVRAELVYRLSILSAALLAPRGQERIDKYYKIKKLYGLRSRAVHGETMPEEKLLRATNESYQLLRELLIALVNLGHPWDKTDFDQAIFC